MTLIIIFFLNENAQGQIGFEKHRALKIFFRNIKKLKKSQKLDELLTFSHQQVKVKKLQILNY